MSSNPLREPLAHLESLLVQAVHTPGAETFTPVLNAFFDLVDQHHVRFPGNVVREPKLATAVGLAVGAVLGDVPAPEQIDIARLPGLGFAHGTAQVPLPGMVAWFWFDRSQQGLVAVVDPKDGSTHMLRLTLAHVGPEGPAQA